MAGSALGTKCTPVTGCPSISMFITGNSFKVTLPGQMTPYINPLSAVLTYCRVPEGRGLHQTAKPLSRDETWSVNPLVHEGSKALSIDILLLYYVYID